MPYDITDVKDDINAIYQWASTMEKYLIALQEKLLDNKVLSEPAFKAPETKAENTVPEEEEDEPSEVQKVETEKKRPRGGEENADDTVF